MITDFRPSFRMLKISLTIICLLKALTKLITGARSSWKPTKKPQFRSKGNLTALIEITRQVLVIAALIGWSVNESDSDEWTADQILIKRRPDFAQPQQISREGRRSHVPLNSISVLSSVVPLASLGPVNSFKDGEPVCAWGRQQAGETRGNVYHFRTDRFPDLLDKLLGHGNGCLVYAYNISDPYGTHSLKLKSRNSVKKIKNPIKNPTFVKIFHTVYTGFRLYFFRYKGVKIHYEYAFLCRFPKILTI